MTNPFSSSPSGQRGVVLIEAMVAILLFSVGVLAVAGLQAVMVQNTSESKMRAEAGYITEQLIGQMWADPVNRAAGNFNKTYDSLNPLPDGTLISNVLPNGLMFVSETPDKTISIAVGWTSPGEAPAIPAGTNPCQLPQAVAHCFVTNAHVDFN